MYRELMKDLERWKNSVRRKPLVLRGARQVGKTWLLKEFGKTSFKSCAYLRLEDNQAASALFDGSLDPNRIIMGLSALTGVDIQPNDTLIILDEVQAVPRALTALKYFCEEASDYYIAVAGSLMGVALHSGISFPVGKVDFLYLYPMSFKEYLLAVGKKGAVDFMDEGNTDMLTVLSEELTDQLKNYYFVGGMPEVVAAFSEHGDYQETRRLQNAILISYESDFSKHLSGALSERCRMIWQSMPKQLISQNSRFIFGAVKNGARAREYEEAIQILIDSGLALKVGRISKPGNPLSAYSETNAFKLYLLDIGLLCALSEVDSSTLLKGDDLFTEFKGALAEQYVCQQLISECGITPYYWVAPKSTNEVDFVIRLHGEIIPIEVKASVNLKSKSLRSFCERYNIEKAIRFSLAGFKQQDLLRNIPLYAVGTITPKEQS